MQTKIKILIILNLIWLLISGVYVIVNGWNLAISEMENFWLKERYGLILSYKAPRLWELPVEKQIDKIFGKDARLAKAIFYAESGYNCNAVSSTNDIGIAQIQPKYHAQRALKYYNGSLMDCTVNLLVAKEIFDEQGFTPWVAYNSGSYLTYLK